MIQVICGYKFSELQMRFETAMQGLIRARVSPEEKRLLIQAARKRGQSLSEMLRDAATEAARQVAV